MSSSCKLHRGLQAKKLCILLAASLISVGCPDQPEAQLDTLATIELPPPLEVASQDKQTDQTVVSDGCKNAGTGGATSPCLSPTRTPEYYVDQGNRYFDTLDTDADPDSVPDYSPLVARWEWPPWLLLTGFGEETLISTDEFLKDFDPSTVPERDCRFFPVQPFCRCYVTFVYEGGPCPIYEEFTFNDQGKMTFIEAWSDLPGMLPMPDPSDRWAEGPDIHRLSTKVPGLGNPQGLIDLDSDWMKEAGAGDPEIADFAMRASDQWHYWAEALKAAGDDFFAVGCGWQ